MRSARFADLLFTGLAIVPAVVILDGHPGFAMLVFPPLLIAACLWGAYEQATDIADDRNGHADCSHGGDSAPSRAIFGRRSKPGA